MVFKSNLIQPVKSVKLLFYLSKIIMILKNLKLIKYFQSYIFMAYVVLVIFCMINNILINIFLKIKRTIKQFSLNKYVVYLVIMY